MIKQVLFDDNNVLDCLIYEDVFFIWENNVEGNIIDIELGVYFFLFDNMMNDFEWLFKKVLDLMVYLEINFDMIFYWIKKWGCDYE